MYTSLGLVPLVLQLGYYTLIKQLERIIIYSELLQLSHDHMHVRTREFNLIAIVKNTSKTAHISCL